MQREDRSMSDQADLGKGVPVAGEAPAPAAASLMLVWLTLGLCLILTAAGYRYSVAVDERDAAKHLETSVTEIEAASGQATYMLPLLEELQKVFAAVQKDIDDGVPVDTTRLNGHLWAKPPLGLETTSLQLLPRVSAAEVQTRTLARALTGSVAQEALLPIVQLDDDGKTADLASQEEYFPVLVQTGPAIASQTSGLDRTLQPLHRLAMAMARDAGQLASVSSFPMNNSDNAFFATVYYFPLYRGGAMPATVEARRQQLVGFVSAYTRTPAKGAFEMLPQAYHGIEAAFTVELPKDPAYFDRKLAAFLSSDEVKRVDYSTQGLKFSIAAVASPALRQSLATSTRWWVLGLGLLATGWMQSMLLWARHQSRKIVNLVEERTRDLAARTADLTSANRALLQSERRYRVLADNISDVIYTCNTQGVCTYVSPSVYAKTGYAPEEIVGKPIFDLFEKEAAERARGALGAALGDSAESDCHSAHEFNMRCKNGSIITMEASIGRLQGETGKIIGTLGVMRDISERKRAEQEKILLEQAYQQAQKMEAVGTLAGGVAHDFNNLLTGVLGHADMLKQEFQGSPDSLRSVELIEMAATRAKELTGQLLGFARKGKFMQVPVDINKILADLLGLLERTVDKNITITHVRGARNPLVLGDPGQISQIFLNLAVNARDAMPKGGTLTFKTEILSLDELSSYASFGLEPGDYCAVTVSDTGIGIAEDKLERIFEPFFTDKEEGKGTGLGLAMVYGVVKNHKGGVRVYSEVGKGTVFSIFLPLHEGVSQAAPEPKVRALVAGSGKVLLVDDQPLVRQVGERMLQKLGYEVVTRNDGVEGLEYYRDHWSSIDIVLMDMVMPRMGGIECLDEMKRINPGLKAVLCTGFSREDIAGKIQESHILGFIQKPYRMLELSEVVAGVNRDAPLASSA